MKNILPFLAVIGLAIPPQAFALIGGPFDQNTPSGLYGGTYEAIYKFKNGNGIVRFSNSDSIANLNLYSFSLIFYKGIIYQGNAAGSVNPKEGYATGMSSGVTTGVGEEGESAQSFISGAARNIGICNANWFGKVDENGYHVRFSGKGVAHFFGQLDQEFEGRTSSDTEQSTFDEQSTIDTEIGSSIPNITITPGTPQTTTIEQTPVTTVDPISGAQVTVITETTTTVAGTPTIRTVTPGGLRVDWDGEFLSNRFPQFDRISLSTPLGDVSVKTADEFRDDENAVMTISNVGTQQQSTAQQRSNTINQEVALSTGGEEKDFENVGHRVKIRVYGSKVSVVAQGVTPEPYTPLNPLNASENAPISIVDLELKSDDEGIGAQ